MRHLLTLTAVFAFLAPAAANPPARPTPVKTEMPGVWVEVYTDRAAFDARLGGNTRVVDFDDVDTSKRDFAPFAADRYKKKFGIVITGADGQYAGRTFGFPHDYVPKSKPNSYAPGPESGKKKGRGGCETLVTFHDGGRTTAVAGFGCMFIDADYPKTGPCTLVVRNAAGKDLAAEKGFSGRSGEAVFRGMIAVNSVGMPVSVIQSVQLVNGNGWPANGSNEGVTLDDFVFAIPGWQPSKVDLITAKSETKTSTAKKGAEKTAQDWLREADDARLKNRLEEAVQLYAEVLRLEPKLLDAFLGRGEAYRRLHRSKECLADLTQAIELDPRNTVCYVRRGSALTGFQQYDKALVDLNTALQLDRTFASAYYMRSRLHLCRGDAQAALADADRAIQLAPQQAEFYELRGNLYLDSGHHKQAWADANAAVQCNPRGSMGYVLRALICVAEEQYDKALKEWNRAVELEPGNPVIHALRSCALARLGRGEDALRAARTGHEMSSGRYPENVQALGMAYWIQGKYSQAIVELGRVVQTGLPGTVAEALEIRARCYIALKQFPNAAQDLHKAFEMMPNDPRLHDVAALYYRATNDPRVTQFETKAKELRQKMVRVTGN